MSDERTACKIDSRPGVTIAETSVDYTDGYRVTIGWDGEDWCAQLSGLSSRVTPANHYGHGKTHELALLDLACSLAATIDFLCIP